ncbi:MAG TPA: NAD(P)-dependent oxidoreductase [Candidatus Limnocylindrales bacterium]|nr:NAD(P)-dependent oxidoreductase [Candidatus Limnocylindrales bacterium]
MRVAVSGAGGRLGRALIAALEDAPFTGPLGPIPWGRDAFDLDEPGGFAALLDGDRPEVVVHAAAWTDVDGCAREPDRAIARNADATGVLAAATAERGIDLLVVSTNEVFDGRRDDALGYGPDDAPNPINPYGASKLAGEDAARASYGRGTSADLSDGGRPGSGGGANGPRRGGPALGIVRTAWLFGPPGNDFPSKILAAATRARNAGEPLRLVADEVGSPTFTVDLAEAIVELIAEAAIEGTHHVVNRGVASRADWGREVLRQAGIDVATEDVPAATWPRASTPPAWAVLAPSPLPGGEPLRPWQRALADRMPELLREAAAGRHS